MTTSDATVGQSMRSDSWASRVGRGGHGARESARNAMPVTKQEWYQPRLC